MKFLTNGWFIVDHLKQIGIYLTWIDSINGENFSTFLVACKQWTFRKCSPQTTGTFENEVRKPRCSTIPAGAHIWVAINGFGAVACQSIKVFIVSFFHCLLRSLFLIAFLFVRSVFLLFARLSSLVSLCSSLSCHDDSQFRRLLYSLSENSAKAKLQTTDRVLGYQDFHSW